MRLLFIILNMALCLGLSAQDTLKVYLNTGAVKEYVNIDRVKMSGKALVVYSQGKSLAPISITRIDSVKTTHPQYITTGELENYSIVYSSSSTSQRTWAQTLQNKIKAATGCTMSLRSDGATASDYEIIIGDTRRQESRALKAGLGNDSWAIGVSGHKIIIVGCDLNYLALALTHFSTKILGNPLKTGDGYMCFTVADTLTQRYDYPQTALRALMKNGTPYKLTMTKVVNVPVDGTIKVAQGVGSDGRYVYFANRESGDTGARVYKYDMKTWQRVGASPKVQTHHTNDLTVDTKNNRVLVVNGTGAPYVVSEFDCNTMEHTRDITLSKQLGAFAYCAERDAYAGSQGGKVIRFCDANFKFQPDISRTDNTGLVAQGMGCDKDYIYFPMSGKEYNLLVVYDWAGKYVGEIRLDTGLESESMFIVNDVAYVNFYQNCATLYRLDISLQFE